MSASKHSAVSFGTPARRGKQYRSNITAHRYITLVQNHHVRGQSGIKGYESGAGEALASTLVLRAADKRCVFEAGARSWGRGEARGLGSTEDGLIKTCCLSGIQ